MPRPPGHQRPFEGFSNPNTTSIPDEFLDFVMQDLSLNELRIMLYVMRRTFGFKKDRDAIALNQFMDGITTHAGKRLDRGCGIRGRGHLMETLRALEEKGYLISEAQVDGTATVYRLRMKSDPLRHPQKIAGVPKGTPLDPNGIEGGSYAAPPGAPNGHLQKTDRQETDQETDQETGPDPAHLWETVKERLAQVLARPVYETYLADTEAVGLRGANLLVSAQDDEQRRFLQAKLLPWVLPELQALLGPSAELTVR